MDAGVLAPSEDCVVKTAQSARILTLFKENRIEMMIATILLYSTGLLEKAVSYSAGVC